MSQQTPAQPTGQGHPMDMIRPEQLLKLPMLNEETKNVYSTGLTKLWAALENHPKESEQYQLAMGKIKAVSKDIMVKISTWKSSGGNAQRPQSQGQGQGQGQPRPANQQAQQQGQQQQQAQLQNQPTQPQQPQPFKMPNQQPQNQGQAQNAVPPQQQQQQNQAAQPQQQQQQQQAQQQQQQAMAQLSPAAKNFISRFQIFPPPNVAPNSPEWEPYKARLMRNLTQAVVTQESSMQRFTGLSERITQMESTGQQANAELLQARESSKSMAQSAKQRIEALRAENDKNRLFWQAKQKDQGAAAPLQQSAPTAASPVQNPTQTQQLMNQAQPQQQPPQQQQQPQQSQPPLQQPQQMPQQIPQQQQQQQQQQMRQQMQPNNPMYAASPTTDNSQNPANSARPNAMSPAVSGAFPNQNQPANSAQAGNQGHNFVQQQQQQQQQPQQQQQAQNSSMARPQPAPHQQNFQSPSTQAAPVAGQQAPQPLSHQAAISQANRSYSQQATIQGTPNPADSTPYPQMATAQNSMNVNQKFPIPRTLSVPPPAPVTMGPARPTFGGSSSGAPGMMGQPAITKQPGFILEGEGDRVLSKKKLDELVRQVTGGGEGDGLTSDVEEAVLTLADDFVDNVITAACRLAKIRPNSTLDIRDIQIILERNYNIRVPGYSLDEIRTVRKFQPAPGWTQKMNAVQAAKVMGKNDS